MNKILLLVQLKIHFSFDRGDKTIVICIGYHESCSSCHLLFCKFLSWVCASIINSLSDLIGRYFLSFTFWSFCSRFFILRCKKLNEKCALPCRWQEGLSVISRTCEQLVFCCNGERNVLPSCECRLPSASVSHFTSTALLDSANHLCYRHEQHLSRSDHLARTFPVQLSFLFSFVILFPWVFSA